jgi:hypothetical protein
VARMPVKFAAYTGCDIKINDRTDITPRILYMWQAKANELMPGILMYYTINDKGFKTLLGLDYRVKDAFIVSLGISDPTYSLRVSYDINTSYLKNYTGGRGAFEVSLIYRGKRNTHGENFRSERQY